ncbi:MAG: hypothetical protein ACRDY6_00530 [Acidimicrobiia bacterium]
MSVEPRATTSLRPPAVLRRALAIVRRHGARVVGGALACLVAPAVVTAVLAELFLGSELRVLVAVPVGIVMTAVSAGGVVVFAGYLDLIVHTDRLGRDPAALTEVVPRLPIWRLLAANAVLFALFGIGSAFFLVPGLVVLTWFSLVGSMIVTGGATSLWDGFARSRRVVRGHFWLVLLMVTVPLVLEHDIVLIAEHAIDGRSDVVAVVAAVVIILLVNISVALVEVVLAEDLREGALGVAAKGE